VYPTGKKIENKN